MRESWCYGRRRVEGGRWGRKDKGGNRIEAGGKDNCWCR